MNSKYGYDPELLAFIMPRSRLLHFPPGVAAVAMSWDIIELSEEILSQNIQTIDDKKNQLFISNFPRVHLKLCLGMTRRVAIHTAKLFVITSIINPDFVYNK